MTPPMVMEVAVTPGALAPELWALAGVDLALALVLLADPELLQAANVNEPASSTAAALAMCGALFTVPSVVSPGAPAPSSMHF